MAKHFKLRLSLSSFRFCRPKQPYWMPQDPTPVAFWFSPVNPKSLEITYPNVPEPPPSTPDHLPFKYPHSPRTKPVDCGCKSLHNTKRYYSDQQTKPHRRMDNSLVSDTSDDHSWTIEAHKNDNMIRRRRNKKKKAKASVRRSTSSANSDWCTDDDGYEDETESLVLTSKILNSSNNFGYSLETITEQKNRKTMTTMKTNNSKAQRQKKVKAPVWKAEGKVKESYAVVKNSDNPCEDFKRSMLEMVLEKQMFKPKELEQLLMCFLSLNSRIHHAAIVEAFSEVWEILFFKSPKSGHCG